MKEEDMSNAFNAKVADSQNADSHTSSCAGQQVVECKPNGFCIIHIDLDDAGNPVDWTFVQVNEFLAQFEGVTADEMLGHSYRELFPHKKLKWIKNYYEAAYEGKSFSVTDILEKADRYLHIEAYPVAQEGCCACVVNNIRESVIESMGHQEERDSLMSMYENEHHQNALVRHYATALGFEFPLAISMDYILNRYEMVEYDNFLNKTASESGTIDELIRVGASTVPDPQAAQQFMDLFNREAAMAAFRSGQQIISLRHPQNGDDGKVHYMDTRVICTECTDESITAVSVSKCIDDEVAREHAVSSAADRAATISALSDIYSTIVVGDLTTFDFKIVKCPEAVKGLKQWEGYSFDQIMELLIKYAIHEDMRDEMSVFLNPFTVGKRLEDIGTLAMEYKTPDGGFFEGRFVAKNRDEDGHVKSVLFVARNITVEKNKELSYLEQLRQAAIEAEKANVSKTNFLRRMSHDIRTPLNGIVGMLHIMERNEGDREKYQECMDKVFRSIDYLLAIVNNVLDVGKMESGEIELENKSFDLARLLLNTLPIIESNAKRCSIAFLGGAKNILITHRYLVGSPVHLNRVLMNLASNSVKYNHAGGSIQVYCNELDFDGDQASYEFVCADTGVGMSEEFQKRAFEPFTQEGKTSATSFSGSGLGLSIVKEIVNKMGGTIELKSEEGVGTTVRIVLTFDVDKDYVQEEAIEKAPDAIDLSGRKALLVEDNDINLEIAQVMLEEMNLEVVCARNGQEAVDIFRDAHPYTFDFIFMDMMMPVMDGLKATRAIRDMPRPDAKDVPIIAMTANAFADDKQDCLDAGMDDHIGKPIDPASVLKTVARFIEE